jgi:hypothetical protein
MKNLLLPSAGGIYGMSGVNNSLVGLGKKENVYTIWSLVGEIQ